MKHRNTNRHFLFQCSQRNHRYRSVNKHSPNKLINNQYNADGTPSTSSYLDRSCYIRLYVCTTIHDISNIYTYVCMSACMLLFTYETSKRTLMKFNIQYLHHNYIQAVMYFLYCFQMYIWSSMYLLTNSSQTKSLAPASII